jgi:integrase
VKGSTRKYKLRDGESELWLYTFRTDRGPDGKRHSVLRRGFTSKRDADDALRKAIAAYRKSAVVAMDTELFADAFNEWRVEYGNAHWEPSTQESNVKRGGYAVALFGSFKLGQLTTQQIDLGLNQLKLHGGQKTTTHPKGKPLSPKTCHAVYSLLRQFFAQMIVWEKIEKNPMLGVRAPTGASDSQAESLTPDEYNRLLARVKDTRYYAMAVFGGEAGARCGELLALKWSDVDEKSGDVTISKSLQQTKAYGLRVKVPKNTKTRITRISPETLAVLLEHRRVTERDKEIIGEGYCDNGLVFPSPVGEFLKPKQVSGRVAQFMRDAGIEKSLHKLRHFCATVRLANGESPVAVAGHLGHDANVLLKIYAHVMPGDRAKGVAIWQKAISEIVEQQPEPPKPIVITAQKPDFVITNVVTRSLKLVKSSIKSA